MSATIMTGLTKHAQSYNTIGIMNCFLKILLHVMSTPQQRTQGSYYEAGQKVVSQIIISHRENLLLLVC